jgi:hypothetical protein
LAVSLLVTQLPACGSAGAPAAREPGADVHAEVEAIRDTVTRVMRSSDGSWKIHGMTVLTRLQTGNTKLLQEAGAAH